MTGSPFQRAQEKFRPILKPKNPLRRQTGCAISQQTVPTSPTFTSSASNSSSISGHGMQSSTSTSSFTSTGSSCSSSTSAANIRIGDQRLSLPLLATAGVSIFVLTLVLRAVYTFGTSLLRLFVLVVFVVALLSFSSFNDKQQVAAQRKRAVESALRSDRIHPPYTASPAATVTSPSAPTSYGGELYSSHSKVASNASPTLIASPYSSSVKSPIQSSGHAKYNSAYTTRTTIATTTSTTHPSSSSSSSAVYSADGGRTRQLLTAHQRSPTYA